MGHMKSHGEGERSLDLFLEIYPHASRGRGFGHLSFASI